MFKLTAAILVASTVLLIGSCETTPYTERSQLLLLSTAEEKQLGLEAYQDILKDAKLSTRSDYTEMVRRAGQRIAAVADQPEFNWEFNVIADPTVNAFCLPGGKVAFYEGIMPVCGDETGVAVVMGHEIAHAIARHGGERVSQAMITELGTEAAASILGGKNETTRQLIYAGLGIGTQIGVMLPFSRSHESEADHIGLILMAKAGYDPRAAPDFWRRMEAASSGGSTPEWLSTHPHPGTRIQQLEEWVAEALPYYEASRR